MNIDFAIYKRFTLNIFKRKKNTIRNRKEVTIIVIVLEEKKIERQSEREIEMYRKKSVGE